MICGRMSRSHLFRVTRSRVSILLFFVSFVLKLQVINYLVLVESQTFTMNRNFRALALFAIILVLGLANAFIPVSRSGFSTAKTNLQFGFLKELGLEKPSWLPDFGGKKEEEPVAVAEETDAEEEAKAEGEGEGEEAEEK
jgi:hypothetical protein